MCWVAITSPHQSLTMPCGNIRSTNIPGGGDLWWLSIPLSAIVLPSTFIFVVIYIPPSPLPHSGRTWHIPLFPLWYRVMRFLLWWITASERKTLNFQAMLLQLTRMKWFQGYMSYQVLPYDVFWCRWNELTHLGGPAIRDQRLTLSFQSQMQMLARRSTMVKFLIR